MKIMNVGGSKGIPSSQPVRVGWTHQAPRYSIVVSSAGKKTKTEATNLEASANCMSILISKSGIPTLALSKSGQVSS